MNKISIFIFVLSLSSIICQNEFIGCTYYIDNRIGYSCNLTISNPLGRNDFMDVTGEHLEGYGDDDLLNIEPVIGQCFSTNVPSIICAKYPNLLNLYLYHVGIQHVDKSSFFECKKLTELSVAFNNITSISADIFTGNLNLEWLGLYNNSLTSLPEDIFVNLHKLFLLAIGNNAYTDLPTNIFRSQRSLFLLGLAGTQIRSLRQEWFDPLVGLVALYMKDNPIEELPINVFSGLRNINNMVLDTFRLKIIHSKSFGVHPNLAVLKFNDNQIDAIDERLFRNVRQDITLSIRRNKCANTVVTGIDIITMELQNCFANYQNIHYDNQHYFRSKKMKFNLRGQNEELTKLQDILRHDSRWEF